MTRAMCVVWVALSVASSLACDEAPQPPTSPSASPRVTGPPAPPPPAPAPDHPLTGSYSLSLDIGSGCAGTLGAARVRTYDAAIGSTDGTNYLVTLGGAPFLSGTICTAGGSLPGCNQFLATRNGDAMTFNLANSNDDGHGGHIVEQLGNGTWIELIGSASGTMRDGTLEASGTASVWYCGESRAYPFPCGSFTSCTTDDMRLTFTRR